MARLIFYFSNNYFTLYVWVSYLHVCIKYYMCAWCLRSEKRGGSLELELQVVLSYHVVLGTRILCKNMCSYQISQLSSPNILFFNMM